MVCLHCGVIARVAGPDTGTFICPISGTEQAFHRLRHKPHTAVDFTSVSKCYEQEMLFIELPHDPYKPMDPRDCSRAAVLAYGYDSSSGDDNGEQYLCNPSLWDEDDDHLHYLGTQWDVAPMQYVPLSKRNPAPSTGNIKHGPAHATAIQHTQQ